MFGLRTTFPPILDEGALFITCCKDTNGSSIHKVDGIPLSKIIAVGEAPRCLLWVNHGPSLVY